MARSKPVLDKLNIVVGDMDASVAFYRRLGIDLPDWAAAWDPHHRSANTGGPVDLDLDSIVFARQWDEGWRGEHPGAVIGFSFATRDDVDEVHAELVAAGYRSQLAPCDKFWGARYAIVEDPDGNPVGLMSPVDPALRRDEPPPA